MKRHKKFKPYVRRANGKETASSFRTALRLAYYEERSKPFYVMVQHGFPNHAIAVGPYKRDLQQCPLPIAMGKVNFKQWAKRIAQSASKPT